MREREGKTVMRRPDSKRARRFGRLAAFLLFTTGMMSVLAIGFHTGFRFNTSVSQPLGLYRIVGDPLDGSSGLTIGSRVSVCPDRSAVFAEAHARGYVPAGPCPSGLSPLLKTVAAVSGDHVTFGDAVRINGHLWPSSERQAFDALGRPLPHPDDRVLAPGEVLLMSDHAVLGFDGRYFGAVPVSWVRGRVVPVWTARPRTGSGA